MYMVFVTLDVLSDKVEQFVTGIHANARASLADEPGCIRFDVQQSLDVELRYHFYEIYVDKDAFEVGHKSAPHYAAWRSIVDECVVPGSHHNVYAEPLFPEDIPENDRG